MMSICEKNHCTGCFACKNICPKDAIFTVMDELGKTIPKIDENLCVKCGLCEKVCPINIPISFSYPKAVYAAWSKDKNDRDLSSSGGLATVFAKTTVDENGIVFGAASFEQSVKHISVNSVEKIEMLRGSKYVQSDIGYTFREAKTFLDEGKKVLFVGTPCQIAGLKNFLGKDFSNLTTVDIICHGTPPFSYLDEYLSTISKKAKLWDKVTFRGKYNFFLTAYNDEKILYQNPQNLDLYFKAFLSGLTYRDNCYECIYASHKRISDITVADFWGLDKSSLKNAYDGRISLVMVNTDKGVDLFKKISDKIVFELRSLEEALSPEQTNIHHPTIPHKDRKQFEKIYIDFGFTKAVEKTSIGNQVRKSKFRRILLIRIIRKVFSQFKSLQIK